MPYSENEKGGLTLRPSEKKQHTVLQIKLVKADTAVRNKR
ncbi:hypothetical protein l11_22400 [Neisseria weaveri LMG 5135]|nr:hypothetical protein l11_22400 [Neisseria weaveri LMG 5135]